MNSKSLIVGLVSLVVGQEKVIVGYYVPWGKVSPDELSYNKVTHINYGFGLLKNKQDPAEISFDQDYDGNALKGLLKARPKNVKVLISLGGWTGSQTFSKLVGDEKHRQKFVNNAMVYLNESKGEAGKDGWGLDGLDIDWEYPGRKGAECNDYSPTFEKDDSDNYALLLGELRKAMDAKFGKGKKLLTAAVRATPFDKDGVPMKDVKALTHYFDFVNLMVYDINGIWDKTTGPNAPFTAEAGKLSYIQAVADWVSATGDPNKVVAGLAFYGRTQITKSNMDATTISVENDGTKPKGDDMDSNNPNTNCNEGSNYSGVQRYRKLREKILTGKTTAGDGFTRYFDKASQTPYLFNNQTKTFISYDDVESLKIKVDHALSKKLRGVMYWDMTQDHKDELLDVLQPFKGSTNTNQTPPTPQAPATNQTPPTPQPPANNQMPPATPPTNQTPPAAQAPTTTQPSPATQAPAPGGLPQLPPPQNNPQPEYQKPAT